MRAFQAVIRSNEQLPGIPFVVVQPVFGLLEEGYVTESTVLVGDFDFEGLG